MRLTIFHDITPHDLWLKSLEKLISPDTLKELEQQGTVHLAVFNDGVVGISVTNDNNIVYLKVRDITRRRGVGRYLLEETCRFIFAEFDTVRIDTTIFPANEQDGLIYFLETQGFVKSDDGSKLFTLNKD